MSEDPRVAAARYRVERLEAEAARTTAASDPEDTAAAARDADATAPESADAPVPDPARQPTATDRAAYVEVAVQQAIRRGEFEDLPGSGKPIPHLGDHHDPDWWIRRKIESEQLTGLGPPALTLRVESAHLDERLDELSREEDVREALEDFNRRVRVARMQLLGGPPVVTPLREVDDEVVAWRERRDAARREASEPEQPAPRRRRGRRARREDE
ncbi:DUF1992 domain-containing protein [Microbacterium thalassium]|uniref:DnaJ homologue subfamily C member 28 conserved domain-containing protein n=1 Tax=Microbacterium thalassium TaxID=362649 RepID=A0A7X0KW95_9MICO|nr:DUF1992 domain-containing protein [Microbacterium thalassium]MBB6393060.1 hypothetical protein [Microbacterium thalassium]GLK22709.1 hypothetical protein GCM10017607_00270 [Microbacterium thalassium]